MTHDTALLVGYGVSALGIVVELLGLGWRRRQARTRVADAGDGDPR